jgi:hypothetical protein
MKKQFDKRRSTADDLKTDAQVFVSAEHLPSDRPSAKLDDKWRGPYRVIEKVGRASYRLDMPAGWRGYNVFNRDRLKPYHEPEFDVQRHVTAPSPPQLIEGEEEWEVEAIHGGRTRKGAKQYLVRWKGYTPENDTWEPEENLANAKDAIKAFEARGRATRGRGHGVRVFSQDTAQPSSDNSANSDRQRGIIHLADLGCSLQDLGTPASAIGMSQHGKSLERSASSTPTPPDNRGRNESSARDTYGNGNGNSQQGHNASAPRLFQRLMVVIRRTGRRDSSVSDDELNAATAKLRQQGLTVYIS